MKLFKYLLLLTIIFNFGCSQDNGCIKRITVPDNIIKTSSGYTFEPSYFIDVHCDFDEETDLEIAEVLKNFSYKIINFKFTSDTGNNTSKLEFEVELKNNNNFTVEGAPIFTMKSDAIEFSTNYTGNNGSCNTIDANGTCTFTYIKETRLDLGIINSFELVTIKYLLAK